MVRIHVVEESEEKRPNQRGWYHSCEVGIAGDIWFHESETRNPASPNQSAYGPYKTFSEAKKDAMDFHQADIRHARLAVQEIKAMRKPK